jgi:hypothetical protein
MYIEKGIMKSAKNPARTSIITHVAGKLFPLSSSICCFINYHKSSLLKERYRRSRSHDKGTENSSIRNKLQKEFISGKANHATYPRTKMIFHQL